MKAKCISTKDTRHLLINKLYNYSIYDNNHFQLINETGNTSVYPKSLFSLIPDTPTFGKLTREEQVKLFESWLDSDESIEYLTNNETWQIINNPTWNFSSTYRIVLVKPSIHWDHVADEYKYLAIDSDDTFWLYVELPTLGVGSWNNSYTTNSVIEATFFKSFKQGTCDWRDSLVKRPGI